MARLDISTIKFSKVYPMYVQKAERKNRSRDEVDQVGVPVLVKVSYYPNWKVTGGDGPYRVAPNLMVVVPTDNQVRLVYEPSGIDLGSNGVSVLGLFALAFLWWRGPVRYPPGDWWEPYPEEPDPFADDERIAPRDRRGDESEAEPEPAPWIPRPAPGDDWAPPSPAMAIDADWLSEPLPADPTDPTVDTVRPVDGLWPAQEESTNGDPDPDRGEPGSNTGRP